ncbi:MAG: hypothetical protein ACOVNY_06170 [Chitinophagaceae bacterium]
MLQLFNHIKPLKWLIAISTALIVWLAYADATGWRIFSSNQQEKWSASGPGSHK